MPVGPALARGGGARSHPRCRVAGGKVIGRDRQATLIDLDEGNHDGYGSETIYGCLGKRGRPIDLADASSNSQGFEQINLAALAGPYVAISSLSQSNVDPSPAAHDVSLYDLRIVKRGGVAKALARFAGKGTFVISARGAAAQLVAPQPAIVAPPTAPAGAPGAQPAQPGTVTVFDARGARTVDTGNVAGLMLHGLTLSWTHEGVARSLLLRPRGAARGR